MIRRPAFAALAALALYSAVPAGAGEYTTFQPLWIRSAAAPDRPACGSVALLNLPMGWRSGDAAVVLLTTTPVPGGLRDPLIAALLDERTAVLEMVSGPGRSCAIDGSEDSARHMPADPISELLGALIAVTRDAGAGMVVAIGYGPGAAVALDAVREDIAAQHVGSHAARFAAAAALADGPSRFARGEVQQVDQQALARFGLLCQALSQVVGGLGAAMRDAHGDLASGCRTTLASTEPSQSGHSPILTEKAP